jgi:hypothetical protein
MDAPFLPVKDFRAGGFFQEANRQFFHPLGLALVISTNEQGEEFIAGIWDGRTDAEGFLFPPEYLKQAVAAERAKHVEAERLKHAGARDKMFGSSIQPVG